MGIIISFFEKKTKVLAFHSADQWNEHFDASKLTDKLLVIDFYATWCPPCQYIAPKFKDLAAQYVDVEFVKIDVDELQDVAKEFEVTAIPTFVLVKRGQILDRLKGADENELNRTIEEHRKKKCHCSK